MCCLHVILSRHWTCKVFKQHIIFIPHHGVGTKSFLEELVIGVNCTLGLKPNVLLSIDFALCYGQMKLKAH
jgi:uncharacterized membrane protein YGL010W